MTELVEGTASVEDIEEFLQRLDEISERHDVTVQAFDARMIVDRTHLDRAVELADRAIARGENVARERGVEILLYAAGRRQIDQALTLGVEEGEGPVVVLVDGDGDETAAAEAVSELLVEERLTLGEFDEEQVMEFFEITDKELGAVEGDIDDLVHERVALLTVER